ncbi:hypothetical protein HMPREF9318_00812 [Streptococcus urinalis FB127-CNA-2]|uniref:Oxidoreductase, short chain dehydrogenase/reductase family protein n=1 Tax=Streptococcus urinalis 2285-97 TaxID=764291 RepID=G5KHU6_9STRE|nr:SDR family NAD(P)-dependent oxidoreductase [Streptococcus urinalis]EHJ57500.1 oxidoreductase, short chain dehydrogenase/reductase family protein [Streptococcus urinalis 2285-97]EKS22614.1 hypothetical protein HMPREF9318_00812 [Streptococcus urinalis FB127-CNA-2]VEF32383.1 dehydrogenase-like protein [Streptococcus urinalis]
MKTYIITGANSGLGLETAEKIVKSGNHVILACRNLEKGQEALEKIRQDSSNGEVTLKQLDLASFKSIHAFVEDLDSLTFHGLDNNAGLSAQHSGLSADGYDIVFQSNYLGHFLLTLLLLP